MSEEQNSQFPGVFRGKDRVAMMKDLCKLKAYFEQLIAGPTSELAENGYIPWKYTEDGALDIEYLFPELLNNFTEKTGIAVKINGTKVSDSVTSINFQGKFISLDIDENGGLICTIDESSTAVPNFNEANSFGSALVKIENDVITGMIVPSFNPTSDIEEAIYGDWEAGTKVNGINWNKTSNDDLVIKTLGPVFASTLSTYFEITVYDGSHSAIATFVTTKLRASTRPNEYVAAASTNGSPNIKVSIANFKEESQGYSFVPTFAIDLAQIIGSVGGRFSVKIVHHNDATAATWTSEDMLYNYGLLPTMTTPSVQLANDDASAVAYRYCSGLRYASNGNAYIQLNNVRNLNDMAAVEDPVEYDFDIADEEQSELIPVDYDLSRSKIATYQLKLKLKADALNNEDIEGTVVLKNAFGATAPQTVHAKILLNTQTNLKASNDLSEYFSDEGYRIQSNLGVNAGAVGNYATFTPWNSTKSLLEIDDGKGLMVVPGVGVQYPSGNWTDFLPNGSPDYSIASFNTTEKYFVRKFEGNSDTKFGGVFKVEGLTKAEFVDGRLILLVSCDNGRNWLDLKKTRNMSSTILLSNNTAVNAIGILTELEEKDDALFIHWAYPTSISSAQPLIFKLGMKPSAPFCIKSVTLLNTDEEEDW